MDPDNYIMQVRMNINNMPKALVDDEIIYNDLKAAMEYVDLVKYTEVLPTSNLYIRSVVKLASYYSYVNYTSRTETNDGSIPPEMFVKMETLRLIAYTFLQHITQYKLNPDLTMDTRAQDKMRPLSVALLSSVFDED